MPRRGAGSQKGHKEQHTPSFHAPQVLYFVAFATIMCLPVLLAEGVGPAIKGSLKAGLGSPM